MKTISELVAELDALGGTFWFGPAPEQVIASAEEQLGCELPSSFKEFLRKTGGGGQSEQEISGVAHDASEDEAGTIVGDTLRCRAEFGLPAGLVVVFFHFDEVCWCLDTRSTVDGECPVVSYSLALRRVDRTIAPGFHEFFEDFVSNSEEW